MDSLGKESLEMTVFKVFFMRCVGAFKFCEFQWFEEFAFAY